MMVAFGMLDSEDEDTIYVAKINHLYLFGDDFNVIASDALAMIKDIIIKYHDHEIVIVKKKV